MREPPPYLRIAADIRARIAGGTLATGDRVPSTRQLTRQYGVAMATATKALDALRAEGILESKPGSGTVVRAVPHRKPETEPATGREAVVRAAVGLADSDGLDGLSMRRVAARLGVATMTVYRHVRGKEDLHLAMLDAAFAEFPLPAAFSGDWRPRLEFAARRMWEALHAHPWAASLVSMARPQMAPHLVGYTDFVMRALLEHGISAETAMYVQYNLFNQVRAYGLTLIDETAHHLDTGMDTDTWAEHSKLADSVDLDRLPGLGALVSAGFDFDLNRLFEFGLRRLLDGVEIYLA
ncbi:GntR family transcriptional regulator [Sciscionella sediminilitoris]|uniref:GntR family transcriptional regulator n=1 Tax=Sciscionella sediminilitoris TaxID=1445613 RepID=UPI0004DEF5A8|nr:GntR family transcriptional regulator [Sciscionella sp. SE31]